MSIYFIHPNLTIGSNNHADKFFNVCLEEIQKYSVVVVISSYTALPKIQADKKDDIVFFNRKDQDYELKFLKLLKQYTELKSTEDLKNSVFPIAIDKDYRTPPTVLSSFQSFEVADKLKNKDLHIGSGSILAVVLARRIIAGKEPTLYRDKIKFFISHRRIDGEEIAALFERALKRECQDTFRDLIDIEVGENAQDVIEKKLKSSDILLFLQTPKSAESAWIDKELRLAWLYGKPVIWIMIGENNEKLLRTRPADNPHFRFTNEDISKGKLPKGKIEDIVNEAFEIIKERSSSVFDYISAIKEFVENNRGSMNVIDSDKMLYRISMERRGYRYPQRRMEQIIQMYGRAPKENDVLKLEGLLDSYGYKEHEGFGYNYDSAILLSNFYIPELNKGKVFIEGFTEYIKSMERYVGLGKVNDKSKRGVIISGAFSDSDLTYQHELTSAILAIVQAVLRYDGKVIFGAHPTFKSLIFDISKKERPIDFKESVHLYISKWFVNDDFNKYSNDAAVYTTEKVNDNLSDSLTLVRRKMIEDEEAIALVCLGGKKRAEGHNPGVDEEIDLAMKKGIPVFLIGSVGGRSSELANELDQDNWGRKINNCSIEENRELMNSLDYNTIAYKLLKYIGLS